MATLAEKEAEIRARVKVLLPNFKASAESAVRPIYRYMAIKEVDGIDKEITVDIAVYNQGAAGEMAVEIDSNKEPITDPLKQAFIDWFNGQIAATDIVAYQEISRANGPGVVVPRVTLNVWILDPATGEVSERRVFAWMDAPGSFQWKYMAEANVV